MLHRDLKPGNIMIDGRGQVLITDFGLAGIMGQIEGAEARNGTPGYMAPEQLSGKEVSAQSDVYALGVVLYEMFTGKRPFNASTRAELIKHDGEGNAARLRETSSRRSIQRLRTSSCNVSRPIRAIGRIPRWLFQPRCRAAIRWRRRWPREKRRRPKWWRLPARRPDVDAPWRWAAW